MSLTSTVPGERGCNHHVLAWEENHLQTLTCRPGLVPEPPGTAWVDEAYQCRFFTGGDNFFYSDEMPGGPHTSLSHRQQCASHGQKCASHGQPCGEAELACWDHWKKNRRPRVLSPPRTVTPHRRREAGQKSPGLAPACVVHG